MGFGHKRGSWVKECVSTAKVAILVNGWPSHEVQLQKGFRQGEPLSLFLFIMAVKGLSLLHHKGLAIGLFGGISVGASRFHLSHLQFPDGILILYKKDMKGLF